MRIIILMYLYCVTSSVAWLAPERCAQGKRPRRSDITKNKTVPVSTNITQIADELDTRLKEQYKDYKLFSMPVGPACIREKGRHHVGTLYIRDATNCSFHTKPLSVFTVKCVGASACSLAHTVTTEDSYTATEGYNWGVTVSGKLSAMFSGFGFEVGAEPSVDGTYSCAYTKGGSSTDTVECSDSSGRSGTLQLYRVKSDMQCDIRKTVLEKERRKEDSRSNSELRSHDWISASNYLTKSEISELRRSAIRSETDLDTCTDKDYPIFFQSYYKETVMIDPDRISDGLLRKLKKKLPLFNPSTDLVQFRSPKYGLFKDRSDKVTMYYFKKAITPYETLKTIIPFTNENGDAIHEYACIFTPS